MQSISSLANGNAAVGAGEYQLAHSDFLKAVALYKYDGAFHNNLGWNYYHLGKLSEAESELRQVQILLLTIGELGKNLSTVLYKQGKYRESKDYLSKAQKVWGNRNW